jgi:hypothetical protein
MKKIIMDSQLFITDERTIVCSVGFFFAIKKQLSNDELVVFFNQKFENRIINEYITNWKLKKLF